MLSEVAHALARKTKLNHSNLVKKEKTLNLDVNLDSLATEILWRPK